MRVRAGRVEFQCMANVGSGFFRRAEFQVIQSHDHIQAEEVGALVEGRGEITGGGVIVKEALVCEAEIHLSLDQGWIESENLLEFFRSATKVALSKSRLTGAK